MPKSMSLASALVGHPFGDDEPLLHSATTSLTAGEARDAARATATALRDAGVQPQQAVAVQLPNEPQLITAMVGVWLADAVFVPVNPRFPDAEVATVLAATRPAAILDTDRLRACPSPRTYGADDAVVLWTSGTTGAPKPIVQTHRSYLEMIDRVLDPLRATSGRAATGRATPNLVPVGLTLNAGIYNVIFGLRAGAAVVVMDHFDPVSFAELVRRFEIRSTVLPPAAITMLNDDERITDLAPLRYVRSITAPLSPLQATRFTQRFGALVLNGYGQAEIGEVIGWTARDAREHPEKIGAAGRPHPGVEIRVVDERGAPTEGVGRLLVRTPQVASSEQLAGRIDDDGYLDTGDEARIDTEGFVWIEGRASDVINRGGNKVFPSHVEEVLRLASGVVDAAVIGVPDERLGEVPVAYVVTDRDVHDDELLARCREHLAPYKVPIRFHRIAALPRSEVGKVLRQELALRDEP
jgi:acyl-coenzyme A synthetase/AMP-(fatty) acid ligase